MWKTKCKIQFCPPPSFVPEEKSIQFKNNLIFQKSIKRFLRYEVPRVVKIIKTESWIVVTRGWRQGRMEESLLNGHRESVLQGEKGSVNGWW